MPPNWGDGDDWLDVSPRRRKARRQADLRQEWQMEDNHFREENFAGNRQNRFGVSREDFGGSNADYYQDRDAEWYYEETDKDWEHRENKRRVGGVRRSGTGFQSAALGWEGELFTEVHLL